MKPLLIGLLFFMLISCTKTHRHDQHQRYFKFDVDSLFVESFVTKGLKEIQGLEYFNEIRNQIQSRGQMKYYQLKEHKLSDTISIKIIVGKPVFSAVFDGEFKVLYLLTMGSNGNFIDLLRIGKTETEAEYYFLETSTIENVTIRINSDESTLEEDSINGSSRVHKLKSTVLKITKEGRIKQQL